MKHVILAVLFILVFNTSKSQTVFIYSVTPLVCPGDSFTVACIWDGSSGTSSFSLTTTPATTWIYPNSYFNSEPYVMYGVDKIRFVTLKMPDNSQLGSFSFNVSFFQGSSNSKPMTVGCDVGIREYKLEDKEVIYFNLKGEKTDIRYNEIIIQQKGLNRKKILIQNY